VAAIVAWPTQTAALILLGRGLAGAGLKSVWNWIGVAASDVLATGLRILPFVSGYEPGTEPRGKLARKLVEKSVKIEAGMAPFGYVQAPRGKFFDYLIDKSAELVMRSNYSSMGSLVAVLQAAKNGVFGGGVQDYVQSSAGEKRLKKNFSRTAEKIEERVAVLKVERERIEQERRESASRNRKVTSRELGLFEILRRLAETAANG